MRILIFFISFFILNSVQGQTDNFGAIKFGFKQNGDYIQLTDTIFVKYFNQETDELYLDTAYTDSNSYSPAEILPIGTYKIEISIINLPKITVSNIVVESERITFIPKFVIEDILHNNKPVIIEYEKPKGFKCG